MREKLGDAVSTPFPSSTRREAEGSVPEGKARAVIGMRRAGKTTFLLQCLSDRAGFEHATFRHRSRST